MKNLAVLRRLAAVLIGCCAALTVLMTAATSAEAATYPPTNPCAGAPSQAGLGIGGQGSGASCGVAAESTHRSGPQTTTHQTSTQPTANTGFDTLIASLAAAALLAGGATLVVAGRRRRHS